MLCLCWYFCSYVPGALPSLTVPTVPAWASNLQFRKNSGETERSSSVPPLGAKWFHCGHTGYHWILIEAGGLYGGLGESRVRYSCFWTNQHSFPYLTTQIASMHIIPNTNRLAYHQRESSHLSFATAFWNKAALERDLSDSEANICEFVLGLWQ